MYLGDPAALEKALRENGLEMCKVKRDNHIFRAFAVANEKVEGSYDQMKSEIKNLIQENQLLLSSIQKQMDP